MLKYFEKNFKQWRNNTEEKANLDKLIYCLIITSCLGISKKHSHINLAL